MRGTKQRALLFQDPSIPREFILGLVGYSKKHENVKSQSYSYSLEAWRIDSFDTFYNTFKIGKLVVLHGKTHTYKKMLKISLLSS